MTHKLEVTNLTQNFGERTILIRFGSQIEFKPNCG